MMELGEIVSTAIANLEAMAATAQKAAAQFSKPITLDGADAPRAEPSAPPDDGERIWGS